MASVAVLSSSPRASARSGSGAERSRAEMTPSPAKELDQGLCDDRDRLVGARRRQQSARLIDKNAKTKEDLTVARSTGGSASAAFHSMGIAGNSSRLGPS